MSPDQIKRIKCPHCGWIRRLNVRVIEEESVATVTRGMSEALRAAAERIKALLDDAQLDQANAWVDMPACPHCGNVYRYNVRTGEVSE
jgi:RNase P subunit RPR2